MRRVSAILSVTAVVLMAVVLMAAGLGAQAKPSFAGEWKVTGDPGHGEPGVDLTITQSATAMTVEYRAGRPAPAPVKLTYKLDGSMWAANKLVVANTTGAGEEKRTFWLESGNLVVETSAPTRKGGAPNITKVTYQKYQRGHGG
jgi:hypothetical protein